MRVEQLLAASALRLPEKTALVTDRRRFSFAELDAMAGGLAGALAHQGVAHGDRVIAFLDGLWQPVVALFGVPRTGAVLVPVAPTDGASGLAAAIHDHAATAIITEARLAATAAKAMSGETPVRVVVLCGGGAGSPEAGCLGFEHAIARAPALAADASRSALDPAVILPRSRQRDTWLSHRNLAAAATALSLDLKTGENDVILAALPVSSLDGVSAVLAAVEAGATLILERASALPETILRRAATEAATVAAITPALASAVARANHLPKFPRLRAVMIAAGPALDDLDGLRHLFPKARMISEGAEATADKFPLDNASDWHGARHLTAAGRFGSSGLSPSRARNGMVAPAQ